MKLYNKTGDYNVKKEVKKPTQKDILLDDFKAAKKVLIDVCRDCGFQFEELFPTLVEFDSNTASEVKLSQEIDAIKKSISAMVTECFFEDWMHVIDTSFSGTGKNYVAEMVNKMIKTDPVHFYPCCACTFRSLAQLGNDNKKESELNYLKEYGAYSTIEDVTNNYGMMLYSDYKKEVTEAFVKGFKNNNKVNFSYVRALFGNVAEMENSIEETQPQNN